MKPISLVMLANCCHNKMETYGDTLESSSKDNVAERFDFRACVMKIHTGGQSAKGKMMEHMLSMWCALLCPFFCY